MKSKYSEAFIEQALVKVYFRGGRTVRSVAEEMSVSFHTVKNWMKRKVVDKPGVTSTKGKRPQDRTSDERSNRPSVAMRLKETRCGET